jgi:hypothetical protein
VGKTKRGKGTKIMVHSDATGLPLGIHIVANPPGDYTASLTTMSATIHRRNCG